MTNPKKINRVLITGISGSGGSYLAEYIVNHHPHVEIHGMSRWHSTTTQDNLAAIRDKVIVHETDLTDFGSVFSALQKVKPDAVFHLAAHANVRASFTTPNAVLTNNIIGTSNLFEAIRLVEINPIIQLCSTSEVYGQVDPKYVPITEETPMRPASPYAVSKVAQDMLGFTYFTSYKMPIIRTRMFTYLNPRRTDLFATAFAKQVAWIERGLQKEMVHGNLDSVRTIIDVRDAMGAYWVAIQRCKPGEVYNIGGITNMKVGEFLERLIALSEVKIPRRTDPNLLRPADVTLQIPSVDKFIEETGWQPQYTFEESLQDLLSYWRKEADKAVQA
ncbi:MULTISPECIES: GDP-mannose 4,6-dehydratase [unclassified Roseofilum]|uniref:GDP-mannose 4,6-dehydratase n=1 Tax=unclassified Roseofilum TaxID=2620099 RepID=UPI000E8A1CE2|nr:MULTISPECIES: GDP-mannose 4,6-dehydratase [unclassified Roseofilum]MBP0010144.1 GDP-mannose 4,6-dehydratase [Roseofilum sp. Belize Diploria]MBP0032050.1 GDP-mannose 4,6-dehydratase [Roseofilum sp. Belize BBD 4]HBQ98615.1 GDP-mannose 4,6-dehydratase [Cyanobacteria bacterium UBA11691]